MANKLVWNKLACFGSFKSHPAGPFVLDAKCFAEIERNFKEAGIDAVFDYNHSSEIDSPAKARGENIASGWIRDIQARADGLYGLVEWTDSARAKIAKKEFRFISPAIRFSSVHKVTGKDIGAVLSSAALTNKPYLTQLPPALASDDGATVYACSEISPSEIAALADDEVSANSPLGRALAKYPDVFSQAKTPWETLSLLTLLTKSDPSLAGTVTEQPTTIIPTKRPEIKMTQQSETGDALLARVRKLQADNTGMTYENAFTIACADRGAGITLAAVSMTDEDLAQASAATRFTEQVLAKSDAFYAREISRWRGKPEKPQPPAATYNAVLQSISRDPAITAAVGERMLLAARAADRAAADKYQREVVQAPPGTFR